MAAFVLSLTVSQSSDAKTVTITDSSNWQSNDENYQPADFDRQFIIVDAFGNQIIAIPLAVDQFTATYDVPENTNPWLQITLNAVGPVTLNAVVKLPAERYYQLAYMDAIKEKCGCGCNDTNLCEVDAFYQGAVYATPIGDSINYQNDIDSAYKLLTL